MNSQVFLNLMEEARAIAVSLQEPILLMQTEEDKRGGRLCTVHGRASIPLNAKCYGTVFPDGTYATGEEGVG